MDFDKAVTAPIETLDIAGMERKVYRAAQEQIDAETEDGVPYEGPRRMAMIRYRELVLLKNADLISFMMKAIAINEIEKRNLWSALEGYDTPEKAAEAEAQISPSEYSNIKTLWSVVIPFLNECGYNIEDLLLKKGSNVRTAIPMLKRIATGEPSNRERINVRYDQMMDEMKEIAKNKGTHPTELDFRKVMVDTIIGMMDDTFTNFRQALDPYRPENARTTDPVVPLYPCLIARKNGKSFIIIEVDNDGMDSFYPTLNKHCEIALMFPGDNAKAYPIYRSLLQFTEGKNGSNLS